MRPLLIRHGVVAYRRGNVAIGLLGPGQVVFPYPASPRRAPPSLTWSP